MIIHRSILATLAFAAIGAAHADELRPVEGRSINLGEVSGVVYYTVERDGFRIVATLAQGEAGSPVRIEALLAPGQIVVLCVPHKVGVAPDAVEIRRRGDRILVQAAPITN